MKKYLFILLFYVPCIMAENPVIYTALGDVIYNNAQGIEKLQDIEQFSVYKSRIQEYIQKVNTTKEIGLQIESNEQSNAQKEYLHTLRTLSKENDYFVNAVNSFYKSAIRYSNSKLLMQMLDTGLVDTQKNKQEIIEYYTAHQEDINASKIGVLQEYLTEQTAIKEKKALELEAKPSKVDRNSERIKYLREKDKREQEALENKLQNELDAKKKQLRERQKAKLSQTK